MFASFLKRFLLPLFLLFATNCWATFPTTGILDNFTRANENPISDGGKWSIFTDFTSNSMQVFNNTAIATVSGSGNYWNNATYTNVEVYASSNVYMQTGDEQALIFRWQEGSCNGYYLYYQHGSPGVIALNKYVGCSGTQLATYNQTMSDGDSFGASMIGNTITIYYESGSSGFTVLGTVTDSTFSSAGSIGMIEYWASENTSFLNFGGGTYIPPVNISTVYLNKAKLNKAKLN